MNLLLVILLLLCELSNDRTKSKNPSLLEEEDGDDDDDGGTWRCKLKACKCKLIYRTFDCLIFNTSNKDFGKRWGAKYSACEYLWSPSIGVCKPNAKWARIWCFIPRKHMKRLRDNV